MNNPDALPLPPPSDFANLGIFPQKQKDSPWGANPFGTAPAMENPVPVLAV